MELWAHTKKLHIEHWWIGFRILRKYRELEHRKHRSAF